MIKTFEELFASHCHAREGLEAMDDDTVRAQLVELPEWGSDGKRIHRSYKFANYWEAIAFVNSITYMVHAEDHHPELVVGYDKVEVRYNTHSVGGISMNDFIGAAKCDATYANRPHMLGASAEVSA
ncbi:MAG: 4a-hydroxytetrahydrobiopterin dehydratase [Burkholderiaceae bacterium]